MIQYGSIETHRSFPFCYDGNDMDFLCPFTVAIHTWGQKVGGIVKETKYDTDMMASIEALCNCSLVKGTQTGNDCGVSASRIDVDAMKIESQELHQLSVMLLRLKYA